MQPRIDDEPSWGDVLGRADPTDEPVTERPPPKPRGPPKDKPLDATVTQAELAKSLNSTFNGVARLFRLPDAGPREVQGDQLRFEREEFNEAAEALLVVLNQHSDLRIVMRIWAPIAGVFAMIEQVYKLMDGFKLRAEQRQAEREAKRQAVTESIYPSVELDAEGNPTGPGLTSNGSGKRGSFWPIGRG